MTYWRTLCQHVVFLVVLAPLFGAVLILVTRRAGRGLARTTALSNACVTSALAGLMLAQYDPAVTRDGRPATLQMTTVLRWIGATDERGARSIIHFAVGVDGVSLWFVGLTALLSLAAIAIGARPPQPRSESAASTSEAGHAQAVASEEAPFYALLLVLESLLLGAFAALDVFLFVSCVLGAGLVAAVLCGVWGGAGRRDAARRFFAGHFAGGLLVLAGLLGLVVGEWERARLTAGQNDRVEPNFFLPRILSPAWEGAVAGVPGESAARHAPAFLFAIGACLLTPLAGRHSAWIGLARESPPSGRILILGGLLGLGVATVLRCVPVLAGTSWADAPLMLLAAANALYIALRATRPAIAEPTTIAPSLCLAATACAGALSFSLAGVTGALLIALATGLAAALGELSRGTQRNGMNRASLARFGVTGLSFFPGFWLVAAGAVTGSALVAGSTLAAMLLIAATASLAWDALSRRGRVVTFREAEANTSARTARWLVVLLTLLGLALGIAPRAVTGRALPTLHRTVQ